jgi:creatinine amidohydrolase
MSALGYVRTRLQIAAAIAFFAGTSLDLPEAGAAPAAREVEIARMTSPEVAVAIADGMTTVILPTGGTEQNGRHMITGKHNVIVAACARRVAEELGDALVAPVLPFVPEGDIEAKTGNMALPGTIGLKPDVFAAVLADAATSLKVHGARTIVLMSDHGASMERQGAIADRLTRLWAADGVRVISAEDYYRKNGGREWLVSQGVSRAAFGGHADVEDTSALMALDPAGVHLEAVHANADGAHGDASDATAARGEHLIALKVAAAVAEIKSKRSAPGDHAEVTPGLFARLYHMIFGPSPG